MRRRVRFAARNVRGVGGGALALIIGVGLLPFTGVAHADIATIGPNGINSTATGLNGDGVAIGQVESGRPGSRASTTKTK